MTVAAGWIALGVFPCESTKAAIPDAGNEEQESLLLAPDPVSKTATVEADRDAA